MMRFNSNDLASSTHENGGVQGCGIMLAVLAIFVCTIASPETRAEEMPTYGLDTLMGKDVYLRKSINGALVFFLNDTCDTYYYIDDDRPYLYSESHLVTLKDFRVQPQRYSRAGRASGHQTSSIDAKPWIEIDFEHQLLGKRTICLSIDNCDSLGKASVAQFLETAFFDEPSGDSFDYYSANQEGTRIHATLCNHIYPMHGGRPTGGPHDNSKLLCSVCFPEVFDIPDIAEETYISEIAQDFYLKSHRQSTNEVMSARLDSLGQSVVRRWPLRPLGYRYRFYLIDDEDPNATAFPGGAIYVNEGLINSFDSEQEILAVLAQEIAHVELRHGLRQYRSSQKVSFWSAVAAVAVGGAVASTTDNQTVKTTAFEMIQIATDVFSEIILNGYSRDHEREADALSQLFMRESCDDTSDIVLTKVLRKLQYNRREIPRLACRSLSATHPSLTERIERTKNRQLRIYDPPMTYEGLDNCNNVVARFSIVALATDVNPTRPVVRARHSHQEPSPVYSQICFASIETSVYLESPSEVKDFTIGGFDGRFDNKADTKIVPGKTAGMVFYRNADVPVAFEDSSELDLKLKNVVMWYAL